MTAADIAYLIGVGIVALLICSLPGLASMHRGGPLYRRAVRRQLAIGWACAALGASWLGLGWYTLSAGGSWWQFYRDLSLVLLGASQPLLFLAIRAGNRAAAEAQRLDANPVTGS